MVGLSHAPLKISIRALETNSYTLTNGELPPEVKTIAEYCGKPPITELNAAWDACQNRLPPRKIEPLE